MASPTSVLPEVGSTMVPPFFFSLLRPPPTSTLFPYTTLFRSDRPGADEQLGGDVPVGGAGGGQPNDLEFLRCEQAQPVRRRRPGGRGLPRRAQLGPGPFGPGRGSGPVEERERGTQVGAGVRAPAVAAQPFAVEQFGAAVLERPAAD